MHSATKKLAQEEVKMDMTPMIDVTFLLLVFFMCSLDFKSLEGKLSAYLPKKIGVFNIVTKRSRDEPIYIHLKRDEQRKTIISLGGKAYQGEDKFEHLRNALKQQAENIRAKEQAIPIIIDPEIDIPFQDLISTLDICQQIDEQYEETFEVQFSAKATQKKSKKK